jgi:hypothetical protein
MLVLFAGVISALQVDITGRKALRKLGGSCQLAFLKTKDALDRAFVPICGPLWKVLKAVFWLIWHFLVLVLHLISEGLRKWHLALIQAVKRAGSSLKRLRGAGFKSALPKNKLVDVEPAPDVSEPPTESETHTSKPSSNKTEKEVDYDKREMKSESQPPDAEPTESEAESVPESQPLTADTGEPTSATVAQSIPVVNEAADPDEDSNI